MKGEPNLVLLFLSRIGFLQSFKSSSVTLKIHSLRLLFQWDFLTEATRGPPLLLFSSTSILPRRGLRSEWAFRFRLLRTIFM